MDITSAEPQHAVRDSFTIETLIAHMAQPAFQNPELEAIVKMRGELWSSICLGRAMEMSTWVAQALAQIDGNEEEPIYDPSEILCTFERSKNGKVINAGGLLLDVELDDAIPYEVIPSASAPWWLHSLKSEIRLANKETGKVKVTIRNIIYH